MSFGGRECTRRRDYARANARGGRGVRCRLVQCNETEEGRTQIGRGGGGGAGGGTGAGGGGEAVANTMGTPRSYLCSATTNTTQAQLATLSSLSVRQTCTKFAQFRQHAIASGRRRAIPDCVLISSCNAGNLRWFARTQANRAGAGLRGIQRQGTGDRHRRSRHRRRSQRRLQEREREREQGGSRTHHSKLSLGFR